MKTDLFTIVAEINIYTTRFEHFTRVIRKTVKQANTGIWGNNKNGLLEEETLNFEVFGYRFYSDSSSLGTVTSTSSKNLRMQPTVILIIL